LGGGWSVNNVFSRKRQPACQGWLVFCNLGYVPLWGIKVTVSEIWRDDFISNRSRLAAEGGRAVSAG